MPSGKPEASFLYLEVTHCCNLRCITCYTDAGAEKTGPLTLQEQCVVIRQAKELGVKTVSLSGSGEPLLYKDLFPLIDFIEELDMHVVVFTNGTLLTPETAAFLIKKRVVLFFKLFSFDPKSFARMSGKENAYHWVGIEYAFQGVSRRVDIPSGLKLLLDAVPAAARRRLVRIETLMTRMNLPDIPEIARFCRGFELELFLEVPIFAGRAVENHEAIALHADEYRKLREELEGILGAGYFKEHGHYDCLTERNPVVRVDGEIGFCTSRGARIGNVRDASLKELFQKARRMKLAEDRCIPDVGRDGKYFSSCSARRYHEMKRGLPCDY